MWKLGNEMKKYVSVNISSTGHGYIQLTLRDDVVEFSCLDFLKRVSELSSDLFFFPSLVVALLLPFPLVYK